MEPRANILLVDDKPADLLALEAILSDLGETLVRAGSGEEALARLCERDFAVVLLDVRMPGEDGYSVARRIRAQPRTAATPIIFLTAVEAPREQLIQAYGLGAVDYLVKPLVPEILRAKVRAFIELFRDRERIRRQEERLRVEAQSELRLMIESVKDYAIFAIDLEGRIATWNRGAERLFGYAEGEVLGQSGDCLFTPEDRAAGVPAEELRRATATGRAEDERWHVRRDGSRFYASGVVTPIRDGLSLGFIKVARDVTEQMRVDEALRASEARFRALVENGFDAVILIDPDATIRFTTDSITHIMGFLPDELVGTSAFSYIHPDHIALAQERLASVLEDANRLEHIELQSRHKDGSYRWLELVGKNLLHEPAVGAVVVNFREITDRKLAEDALRDANRRKDEFLAMLAHELRNPLAAITAAADLERLSNDSEDRRWAAQVVEAQARNLRRMIDDLLDVSRVTRGKIRLEKRVIDVAPVIQHSVDTVRPLLDERRHQLKVSHEPGLKVEADPTRLGQVLVNLLANAAKYTESGGHIEVEAHRDRGDVAITVRDNGVGIPPEQLPRMFELFAQADRSLARSEGGLGIGLTLVKRLVELHGGRVEARSEGTGRGSEFSVRLPAAAPQAAEDESPARAWSPRGRAEPRRILIVDDNVDTARGLGRLLNRAGHHVEVRHDGASALEAVPQFHPHVILLDIGMPGMDGYETARRLRAQAGDDGRYRLIATSGYGQEEDKRRSREAGFDDHLVKPVDLDELTELLAQVPGDETS